ncbi:MAG: SoxR reducing system RseC family protein [Gammaproteobacteria bacterium]|nr:SoxR reducing system RseC family protein [Gammaproteobacteria bacterium]
MIEETATVVKCEGEFAWVEAQRKTTCGNCAANKGCGTSVLAKVIGKKVSRIKAINKAQAREGDTVIVGMNEAALVKGSLAVYMIPLVFMMLFAVTGNVVAVQMAWQTEPVVILFAMIGMVTAGLWLRGFTRRIQHNNDYQPVVLRRLPTPFVAQHSIQGH